MRSFRRRSHDPDTTHRSVSLVWIRRPARRCESNAVAWCWWGGGDSDGGGGAPLLQAALLSVSHSCGVCRRCCRGSRIRCTLRGTPTDLARRPHLGVTVKHSNTDTTTPHPPPSSPPHTFSPSGVRTQPTTPTSSAAATSHTDQGPARKWGWRPGTGFCLL